MPKCVTIEEIHLTVLVPRHLPPVEADAIRQTLTDPTFERRLRRAIRRAFRREASLVNAKVRLSR
jgi:hypothetical protein